MATYQFGVVGATNLADDTYGLLQNFNENETGDEATAQDADGNVAAVAHYNDQIEITAEYILDTDLTLPSRGDIIVVGSTDKYVVTAISKAETNTGFKTGTITFKRWTSNGIPSNT
jgi:hypothetical protein